MTFITMSDGHPSAEDAGDDDAFQFAQPRRGAGEGCSSGGGGGGDDEDGDDALPSEWTGPSLAECLAALSHADAEIRAGAAEALLDVPAGGAAPGERGPQWAYALVATGAIVPLLSLVQAVKRDGNDGLKPVEDCPSNTPAVVAAGDTALLVLAEIANVAASLLAEEGWDVKYDEDTDRPVFVDEESGMQQAAPPQLASTAGDWMASLLLETLTLVQPLTVDPTTGEPTWPVRVLRHVPSGAAGAGAGTMMNPMDYVSVMGPGPGRRRRRRVHASVGEGAVDGERRRRGG